MSEALVSTDGNGRWWRRTWNPQCPGDILFGNCQGSQGHRGPHWFYDEVGSYHWAYNDAEPETYDPRAVAGSIPPSSKQWVSPRDMAPFHYLQFFVDEEITDPTEIAWYEAGNSHDDEGVTRPCSQAEIADMIADGSLTPGDLQDLDPQEES